ncbi:MAG: tRNA pseudouridine(55) synthase TruB [Alphaproteobacteria bacterium]|nr:tRNA pseudouridine(55) synthase TruB [Alphaproteobacteria bacterium]
MSTFRLPAFLVVDKPEGVTSHDVVALVRATFGLHKCGHTGTLDPFATGVLPLALGQATRLIQYLDESQKVYDATIALGSATDTGDHTGTVVAEAAVPAFDEATLLAVLDGFEGVRMQTPPAYSAAKVDGKRLYEYAREGEEVTARARPIRIDGIDLLSHEGDLLRVRIRCGRGTYARVLADEIAIELGTRGHLVALRRERSGPFDLGPAMSLADLGALVTAEPGKDWREVLLRDHGERVTWRHRDEVRVDLARFLLRPIDALGHLPLCPLTEAQVQALKNGALPPAPTGLSIGDRYIAVDGDELLAVCHLTDRGPRILKSITGGDEPPQRRRKGRRR